MSTGMEIQLLNVTQHQAVLAKQEEKLDKWCASGDVRASALIRHALAEMEVNEDLRNCTPTSVYLSLLACAVTGLVPGKLRGYAYLVPFGNTKRDGDREYKVQEATFMIGWKGVKHIGYRAGLHMVSAVVHENDLFDYDKGTTKFVKYREAFKAPGAIIGTAAWCELPRGGLELEFLNLDTLEKIKQAATRIRKSPAWDGPFRDQMQRKSALKRLGKQIEMGEEFLKADAIELAQDEHGHSASALDEFTDGAATRFLGQQSTEAAVFSGAPRPALVQVPAAAAAGQQAQTAQQQQTPQAKPAGGGKKSDKPRPPLDAQSTERPTQSASSSSTSPAASSSASPSAPASTSSAAASTATGQTPTSSSSAVNSPPTSPTPDTSTATSASSSTPAASSPAASSSAGSAPSNTNANQSENSASGGQAQPSDQSDGFGDVAQEPGPDDAFDTAFGEDETNDPVDRKPQSRAEWMGWFQTWAAAHPTRDDILADDTWVDIFKGWANACQSKAEMDADKPVFQAWSKKLTFGRKADHAKGITAIAPDKQILQMQDEFAKRYKAVP